MIFAAFPLDAAQGTIVAHTHRLGRIIIRKGSVLDGAAIAAFRDAGRENVIAIRLEDGDVDENASAAHVAALLTGPGVTAGAASTGRVNLHADSAGLLLIDRAMIDRINLIDPAVTVATLPDSAMVAPRDMIATVKIIPFAVQRATLQLVTEAARSHAPAFALHRFRPLRVGLVLTELPGLKESVLQGTVEATAERIAALGGTLLPVLRCPHAEAPIARACHSLLAGGAETVLIAGASATVDARDVGPAGVVAAGGRILHFGMPVDPGNLICVGAIGEVPAVVLPGCARSPKFNGIDLVLRRLFAGLPAGPSEIMRLGVGGLLKDTQVRPHPRTATGATPMVEVNTTPKIAAIVLAAGQSLRMAPHNKLLVKDATDTPLVVRTINNILSSSARPVLVVLGHLSDSMREAIGSRPVDYVYATAYRDGLAESLKAGIAALPADVAAAVICLGDMPLVTGRVIDRIIAAYDPDEGRSIVVPTFGGRAGNPILWDRRYFADILALSGDAGARQLLRRYAEVVVEVDTGDDSVLRDFDTVESLETLPPRLRPVPLPPSDASRRAVDLEAATIPAPAAPTRPR